MASLTSFESFFGNVFNSSISKTRKNKGQKQDNKHNHEHNNEQSKHNNATLHQHKKVDFESNQKNKNKLCDIKISSYKLKQSKAHRRNSINSKKSQLESNLISLGFNPKNMSLMKQRKLLDKAMKELSSKHDENDENKNDQSKSNKKEDDILGFMKNNDLFIDKKTDSKPNKPKLKRRNKPLLHKPSASSMDLEFGDVLKPDFRRQIDEETFIRTGKANKPMSDRRLLNALKKRDKMIQKRYNNGKNVIVDDHLANNAIKKLKGEKVKNDLNYMKNKLRQKYKKKLRSRRQWKQRIARKEYGINKKLDRRDANIAAYRHGKVARRMQNRITTEQAIVAANI